MQFEFGQEKKIVINYQGQKHEMRLPKIGEQRSLMSELKTADPDTVYDIYDSFFMKLGLKTKASDLLDSQDYTDLIEFIFNPKKKTELK
jgi:hypothetical protein